MLYQPLSYKSIAQSVAHIYERARNTLDQLTESNMPVLAGIDGLTTDYDTFSSADHLVLFSSKENRKARILKERQAKKASRTKRQQEPKGTSKYAQKHPNGVNEEFLAALAAEKREKRQETERKRTESSRWDRYGGIGQFHTGRFFFD